MKRSPLYIFAIVLSSAVVGYLCKGALPASLIQVPARIAGHFKTGEPTLKLELMMQ